MGNLYDIHPEIQEKIVAFFQKIADKEITGGTPTCFSESMHRHFCEGRRERAKRVVENITRLSEEDARWAIRQLVDDGYWLRAGAYGNLSEDEQRQVPGGFVTRMFGNNLSASADELDLLAFAIANAQADWSPEEKLRLLT